MHIVLQLMGYEVRAVRAETPLVQRNHIVNEFNSPESSVQVLIISIALSAFALNLQGECNKGIVMELLWSIRLKII